MSNGRAAAGATLAVLVTLTWGCGARATAAEQEILLGGSRDDRVQELVALEDGGFVGVGQTQTGEEIRRIWVFALDASGNPRWQRQHGPGGRYDVANGIAVIPGVGYAVTGRVQSVVPGDHDQRQLWIALLDLEGELVWERRYGPVDSNSEGGAIAWHGDRIRVIGRIDHQADVLHLSVEGDELFREKQDGFANHFAVVSGRWWPDGTLVFSTTESTGNGPENRVDIAREEVEWGGNTHASRSTTPGFDVRHIGGLAPLPGNALAIAGVMDHGLESGVEGDRRYLVEVNEPGLGPVRWAWELPDPGHSVANAVVPLSHGSLVSAGAMTGPDGENRWIIVQHGGDGLPVWQRRGDVAGEEITGLIPLPGGQVLAIGVTSRGAGGRGVFLRWFEPGLETAGDVEQTPPPDGGTP